MFDVALECGMSNLHTRDGVPTNEGYYVACNDPVAVFEGQLWGAGIWKA